jgi:hypothetical protein
MLAALASYIRHVLAALRTTLALLALAALPAAARFTALVVIGELPLSIAFLARIALHSLISLLLIFRHVPLNLLEIFVMNITNLIDATVMPSNCAGIVHTRISAA